MHSFLQRHAASVMGTLSGFDRIRFRGTLRLVANARGMDAFLLFIGVLFKDFSAYVQSITREIRRATEALVQSIGQEVCYLNGGSVSKEDLARDLAERRGIEEGLIGVWSALEVLWSYDVKAHPRTGRLHTVPRQRKCLHYYFYFFDREVGFMHVRLATWFPLTVHMCINGREWLSRQMDRAGIAYVRRNNTFTHISDMDGARHLMEAQLQTHWPALLGRLLKQAHPSHAQLFPRCPLAYYWSADETEWATDVMFKSAGALGAVYPGLVRHGIQSLGSADVMRFLGRPVTAAGQIHKSFHGEVVTDLKVRPEGARVKHRVDHNTIKIYDKEASVLRTETTINDTQAFKVYRPREGAPEEAPKRWRKLRKGVADLHRRAEVSQAANERYLESMASVADRTPLGQLTQKLCAPVRWKGRRARGLHPLASADAALLAAIYRGEFVIGGFRNRDLREILHGRASSKAASRKQAAAITRQIRLLRAHQLIRKIPRSHRYHLTARGRTIVAALLTARQADTATLAKAA